MLGSAHIVTGRWLTRRWSRGWSVPAQGARLRRGWIGLIAMALLPACAWWYPGADTRPRVELLGVREVDRDGGETYYLVTLRLANPGSRTLRVAGISCSIHVDGTLAAEGFAGALAPLAPETSTRITFEARANLLGSLKLMTGLSERGPRPYRLEVRLRRPWRLLPLALSTSGEVSVAK